MDSEHLKNISLSTSMNYRIIVQGWLDDSWSDRLSGMYIKVQIPENKKPIVILDGKLKDQADLLGVLNNLNELRLSIISVELLAS